MTHDEVVATPSELHGVASQLRGLADRADGLARQASDARGTPSRGQFPSLAVGQRTAQVWADGQQTFADGLDLMQRALARLGEGYDAAADNYQAADTAAADELRSLP
jgi:hypothetical protein